MVSIVTSKRRDMQARERARSRVYVPKGHIDPLGRNVSEMKKKFQEDLKQKKEDNADLQRVKTRTREERSREAQDIMTKEHIDFYAEKGTPKTETECRKEVQQIAERVERQKDG